MKLEDIKDKDVYVELYNHNLFANTGVILTGKTIKHRLLHNPNYFTQTDSRVLKVESEILYNVKTTTKTSIKLKLKKPKV